MIVRLTKHIEDSVDSVRRYTSIFNIIIISMEVVNYGNLINWCHAHNTFIVQWQLAMILSTFYQFDSLLKMHHQ